MADKPVLNQYDRIVEVYELDNLVQRIANVLDEHGVLSIADYQKQLQEARNDAQRYSEKYTKTD